ncbi:MAG: hypothetical protein VB858_20030, partial [Planctomycetaceae bacterium]
SDAGFLDSEWGIKRGNLQEGASIGALVIEGGDGNDRLFGGFLNDTISGGDGADFLAGREGDDRLDGGPGRDLILGGNGIALDRYEAITRDATSAIGDETGFNDSLLFSTLLSPINQSGRIDPITGLTFNIGDSGDWFLLPPPPAQNAFGRADRAVLSRTDILNPSTERITVEFEDPDDQELFDQSEWSGSNISLFAAVQTDPQGELAFLPVEQSSGVPEYYLLHVNNVKSYGIRGNQAPNVESLTDSNGNDVNSVNVQFTLTIDGAMPVPVTVALNTMNTQSDILNNVNAALVSASISDQIFAYLDDSKTYLVLSLKAPGELQIDSVSGPLDRLGFETGVTNRGAVDPMDTYTVRFSEQIGDVTDVPANAADLQIASSFLSDQATLIPLGDLNNDGDRDVIAAVRDTVATRADFLATPDSVHPHVAAGPSFARIHLGGVNEVTGPDGALTATLDSSSLTLQLPAPLLSDSYGVQSHIASGDFDDDGFGDIAVLVATDLSQSSGRPAHPADGLYVLYGRSDFSAVTDADGRIDVTRHADAILTNLGTLTSFVSPGDVVG